VHGLEKEYSDRITFIRVNIHKPENQPLLDQFGFTTTPELYLVNNQGKIIGAWSDGVTREELAAAFERALNGD